MAYSFYMLTGRVYFIITVEKLTPFDRFGLEGLDSFARGVIYTVLFPPYLPSLLKWLLLLFFFYYLIWPLIYLILLIKVFFGY